MAKTMPLPRSKSIGSIIGVGGISYRHQSNNQTIEYGETSIPFLNKVIEQHYSHWEPSDLVATNGMPYFREISSRLM